MDHYGVIKRKPNPRIKANILSLLTFGYTGGLFKKSNKRDLVEDDIYQVTPVLTATKNADKFEKAWRKESEKPKPSMIRLLWNCFGIKYILFGCIHLTFKIINSIYEPEAIGKLVKYFDANQHSMTFYDGLYYACLMIGLKYMNAFYMQNYIIFLQQLAIQIRTCFCSLVYRKALKLTPAAMNEISLGNVITVITKDVLMFEQSIMLFNDMWIEVIRIFVVCYLIYNKMGAVGFVGVAMLLSVFPAQVYVTKLIKDLRLNLSKKTDERLQATQETLSAIKVVKMYTWESIFARKVEEKRVKEMTFLMRTMFYRFFNFLLGMFTSKVGFYVLIMAYIYINKVANAEVIFYVEKNFKDLRHSIGMLIPFGLGRGAELYASALRINKVLNSEELKEEQPRDYDKPKLKVKDVSVTIKSKEILKNINCDILPGLTVVTGPLGCGKSALLKLFVRDYPITEGKVFTEGIFSYCSQDPWLFPSSIKQNILFGQEWNEKRYNEVLRCCALHYDLDLFERGDETIVSDRGLNLSGGQQARINLARAIYRNSDIYLLDDPLHALDPSVQDYIYKNCIKGFLKDKICVFVTHNLKHKNNADYLIVMKDGEITFDGKPDSVKKEVIKELELEEAKSQKSKEKEQEANQDEEADENAKLLNGNAKKFTKTKVYSEKKKEGKVDFSVFKKYFAFGGGFLVLFLLLGLAFFSEFTESYSTRLLTNWINFQQKAISAYIHQTNHTAYSNHTTTSMPSTNTTLDSLHTFVPSISTPSHHLVRRDLATNVTEAFDRLHNGTITWASSTESYLQSIGTTLNPTSRNSSIVTFITTGTIGGNDTLNLGLNRNSTNNNTTSKNTTEPESPQKYIAAANWTLKLYSGMICASIIIDVIKQYVFLNFAKKASVNLHNSMIEKLTTAKMSFFDSHFIGNMLNRFSQDLQVIDERLPPTVNMFLMVLMASGGIVILIASVSLQFLIPAFILVICLYFLRCIYMPAARSLKRLEASTRSPLIGHLNASMEGVTTIRASNAQRILEIEFDRHQDLYTSAHFMTFCVQRAFGFFMDILSCFFVTVVVGKLFLFKSDTASGDVGLAITKASTLAHIVQWALMQWTDLENNMTSVERVLEYIEVSQENRAGQTRTDWPSEGGIVYQNVSLAYKEEKVLKNICFEIKPKQKIGIVGRTGAGKSSIMSTLFRLYDFEGTIQIDGVDTKTLALDFLRNSISVIPQDPLLFQGTIRDNIDPFKRYTDDEVWKILEKVHMKDNISSLDLTITDHGSNFSTGQRQLICLARAIIKRNKIVVLDEATSNMDPDTEFLVQKVINEQFSNCTVFIIAHRLHSVVDCNKIIVMDKGAIVEFEDPLTLMENKNSFFSKMLVADNSHLYDQ